MVSGWSNWKNAAVIALPTRGLLNARLRCLSIAFFALRPASAPAQSTTSVRVTWCGTPFEVAVTTTEKVPGEVMSVPLPDPVPVPPEMTPEEVQLDMPPAKITSSVISSSALRRRIRAKGISASPQAKGRAGHVSGGADFAVVVVIPVAISTNTFPVVLAGTLMLTGLKVHAELGGSALHWKLKTPCEPCSGIITSV